MSTTEREEALRAQVAEWLYDTPRHEKAIAMSWFRAGWEAAKKVGSAEPDPTS